MRKLSIYIHIPFCIRKCAYCDFLSAPAQDTVKERYVRALEKECRAWGGLLPGYEVDTVFFGGGTPSCLKAELLTEILEELKRVFCFSDMPEITVEVNPGTADLLKLARYLEAGVNRLSIGLQSPFDEDLKVLGRIHDYAQFLDTYGAARRAGFDNINIDLMSALPGQSTARYEEGLHRIAALKPEHISAYSLIIEENTPFFEKYASHEELLPDEEEERKMYELTQTVLAGYGYERYEISNYAKPGKECRHNLVYWQGGDYLGLGLGASSLLGSVRFKGIDGLDAYLKCRDMERAGRYGEAGKRGNDRVAILQALHYQEIRNLSVKEQMQEFMFLGLRCMAGVKETEFLRRFGVSLQSVYGETLTGLQKQGLMLCEKREDCTDKEQDAIWKLTPYGIDVSNSVFVEFL